MLRKQGQTNVSFCESGCVFSNGLAIHFYIWRLENEVAPGKLPRSNITISSLTWPFRLPLKKGLSWWDNQFWGSHGAVVSQCDWVVHEILIGSHLSCHCTVALHRLESHPHSRWSTMVNFSSETFTFPTSTSCSDGRNSGSCRLNCRYRKLRAATRYYSPNPCRNRQCSQ